MSVINQMLRDLEQRKVNEPHSEHYIDEINIIAERQFNFWWILLPIMIILVASGAFYLHAVNNKTQIVVLPTLPGDVSEIKHEVLVVRDDVQRAEVAEYKLEQELEKKVTVDKANAVTVTEKRDIKKAVVKSPVKQASVKQPSVKREIYLKKESKQAPKSESKMVTKKIDVVNVKTIKTAPKQTKSKQKPLAEVKMPVVKVKAPAKSSIVIKSSEPQKKTSEQVIYQARQLMENDQRAAIQLLKENLKLVSPDADYYSLLANLQQRRQQYDDAIISYRKALELSPNKGELWIGVALAYRGTGEEDNAVNAFKRAYNADEISPEFRTYAAQQIGRQ